MQSACDAKLNEMQTLAIQRALQRTFSNGSRAPRDGQDLHAGSVRGHSLVSPKTVEERPIC